jgi:hypothetical protein
MSIRYEPRVAPDAERWLAADEMEKHLAVTRYHRRARIELPNERIHAAIHTVVENQAAMGDETPVAEAIQRLRKEGLNRHEAIHAVGSVLAGHMWQLLQDEEPETADPNAAYFEEIRTLTAQKWFEEYADPED